jgi:hypothetical protein
MSRELEFITSIAKMGEKKIIIIPKDYHELIPKEKLERKVRVKIEKI